MAYKNIEDSRAAIRRHYYANKEKYLQKNRARRRQIREFVNNLKASTPCADCGQKFPYCVMDFDHLRDKKHDINRLSKQNNLFLLKREIEKCEIVCSNCHRLRTHNRMLINHPSPGSSVD